MSESLKTADRFYTVEEYLTREEVAEVKHEYHNGNIVEMPGAKFRHNAVAANATFALFKSLEERGLHCHVLSSDMKIQIPGENRFVYPDVCVLCEEPRYFGGREDILQNPLLVVEVLSEKTEAYDRGEKFSAYATLPSFREYLTINPDKVLVEGRYLQEPAQSLWKHTRVTNLEESIPLYSLGASIALKDIYLRIDFSEKPKND